MALLGRDSIETETLAQFEGVHRIDAEGQTVVLYFKDRPTAEKAKLAFANMRWLEGMIRKSNGHLTPTVPKPV